MFFFGHVGITTGAMQAVNAKTDRRVDLRHAAVLSVLPDLIDKPIGILFRFQLGNHTRLWGHSIVFVGLGLGLFFLLRKTPHRFFLWLACAGHLLLDRIWEKDIHALLWPFLGVPPELEMPIAERWIEALSMPYTIFGEVSGLLILSFLFFHYRMWIPGRLRHFWESGLLPKRKAD